jgi:Class III cytochrome C family
MKLHSVLFFASVAFVIVFAAFFTFSSHHRVKTAHAILSSSTWQHMVSPGDLSQAHAALENNCAACHTPVKGVEASKCIVCHADNRALLARQPTAFHANIQSCTPCHLEHRGRTARPTDMDHVVLARIGLRQMEKSSEGAHTQAVQIKNWLEQTKRVSLSGAKLQPDERVLNCATCHKTKDRHLGLFGSDCAQCHTTTKWTVAEFRHPSTASQSCAQCHQAPPSHYMMHFQMISMKVAGQAHANVVQCFLCHQTTSWNDIKGVGWYKHH